MNIMIFKKSHIHTALLLSLLVVTILLIQFEYTNSFFLQPQIRNRKITALHLIFDFDFKNSLNTNKSRPTIKQSQLNNDPTELEKYQNRCTILQNELLSKKYKIETLSNRCIILQDLVKRLHNSNSDLLHQVNLLKDEVAQRQIEYNQLHFASEQSKLTYEQRQEQFNAKFENLQKNYLLVVQELNQTITQNENRENEYIINIKNWELERVRYDEDINILNEKNSLLQTQLDGYILSATNQIQNKTDLVDIYELKCHKLQQEIAALQVLNKESNKNLIEFNEFFKRSRDAFKHQIGEEKQKARIAETKSESLKELLSKLEDDLKQEKQERHMLLAQIEANNNTSSSIWKDELEDAYIIAEASIKQARENEEEWKEKYETLITQHDILVDEAGKLKQELHDLKRENHQSETSIEAINTKNDEEKSVLQNQLIEMKIEHDKLEALQQDLRVELSQQRDAYNRNLIDIRVKYEAEIGELKKAVKTFPVKNIILDEISQDVGTESTTRKTKLKNRLLNAVFWFSRNFQKVRR